MNVRYERRDDGQVDAFIEAGYPLFNEALADSISSLPPRGEPGNGPSAYWVDVADAGARRPSDTGDERPFTSGNITLLRVEGGNVVAAYDFDEDLTERLQLHEFLNLLAKWRERIAESASSASAPLPETYRRNPQA